MTAPTKKVIRYTEENLRESEALLTDLHKAQTKNCEKYAYAPIDLTIYPFGKKPPLFQQEDVDALIKDLPQPPFEKVDIQRCDEKQRLSREVMDRHHALLELLNQAVGRYSERNSQTPVTYGMLQKKIKSVATLLQRTINELSLKEEGQDILFLWNLSKMGAPLNQTLDHLSSVLNHANKLDVLVEEQKELKSKAPRKSPNAGDAWFRNLIDDLCKIWIVIFEKDVTRSNYQKATSSIAGNECVAGGDLVKFIAAVLEKAEIIKTNEAISAAIRKWRENPFMTMVKLKEK